MEATLQEKAAQAAQVAADAARAANEAALIAQLESVKHIRDFDKLAEGNAFDAAKLKSAFITRYSFARFEQLCGRSR